MEQRVSLITLGVRDMKRSRGFYEKLGWVASDASSNAQVTFFQMGGLILGLYGLQNLAEETGQKPGSGFGGFSLGHNVHSKPDVDALLSQAQAAGARILSPARDMFWGGYSGYFADPDGHAWEIAWNPFFPIAEDGTVSLPAD